jgi:hypothetical protein
VVSFIKKKEVGADYNFYKNWLDLNNIVYGGAAGVANFSQITRNRFVVRENDDLPFRVSGTETEVSDGIGSGTPLNIHQWHNWKRGIKSETAQKIVRRSLYPRFDRTLYQ